LVDPLVVTAHQQTNWPVEAGESGHHRRRRGRDRVVDEEDPPLAAELVHPPLERGRGEAGANRLREADAEAGRGRRGAEQVPAIVGAAKRQRREVDLLARAVAAAPHADSAAAQARACLVAVERRLVAEPELLAAEAGGEAAAARISALQHGGARVREDLPL